MRSHLLTSGLFVALVFACSSSSMSVPSGTDAGPDGSAGVDGAAGTPGGPDGQAGSGGGGGGAPEGGTDVGAGGAPEAGADTLEDASSPIEAGGGCNSGLPEMGTVVRSMCGVEMAKMAGTIPDGRYQLTSVSVVGTCTPTFLAPPASRAFTVAGNIWTGVDAMTDAGGAIKSWRHWRAQVSVNGDVLSASYQCGTSDLGQSYSLVDDGVVLYAKKQPTLTWVYRFTRL
jgi:hypothetical protein